MAVVKGIKERVHSPIYDCINVEPEKQLRDAEQSSTLKFFLDVQGKTKLETNLQSAGLLPHYNTFEARAMRVVISDLPPVFPGDPTGSDENLPVTIENAAGVSGTLMITPVGTVPPTFGRKGAVLPDPQANAAATVEVVADVEFGLDRLMELLDEARENEEASVDADDEDLTLKRKAGGELAAAEKAALTAAGLSPAVTFSAGDLEAMIDELEDDKKIPPKVQIRPNNGAGTLLGAFVYNTVTTFFVGEKVMIQMPTWFFPAGAGPSSQTLKSLTHGEPNPTATFRFAEPIFIDKQQNFRVEIEIPDSDTLKEIQRTYGPLKIWVVLDGYMTRNVQ
jgi:hypothetical protein